MNAPQIEIPRYRCHKLVHALKLLAREKPAEGEPALLYPADPFYAPFQPDPSFWRAYVASRKSKPELANDPGYYVVYDDGYVSWSPTAAFEAGYQLELKAPPAFFPLSSTELHELSTCAAAMQWLAGYHWNQEATADSQHDPKDGVDLSGCIKYHDKRAHLFEQLAQTAQKEANRMAGITEWEPVTEKWRAAVRKMFEKEHANIQARPLKSLSGFGGIESYVVLMFTDEPLQARGTGFGKTEVATLRPVKFAVREDRYVVLPSEDDATGSPYVISIS